MSEIIGSIPAPIALAEPLGALYSDSEYDVLKKEKYRCDWCHDFLTGDMFSRSELEPYAMGIECAAVCLECRKKDKEISA